MKTNVYSIHFRQHGYTALQRTAHWWENGPEACRLLLDRGADPNTADEVRPWHRRACNPAGPDLWPKYSMTWVFLSERLCPGLALFVL